MSDGTVHFEKVCASTAANIRPFGDMDGGYFGLPRREETALDRGLADVNAELRKELTNLRAENKRLTAAIEAISGTIDVNAELRKELTNLRAENKRLTAAIEAISGTIAIYRAHQP